MHIDNEVQSQFDDACKNLLGDPGQWVKSGGYPESVALCIIDSIQSTGPHYTSVLNVVKRYRSYRAAKGQDADLDGVLALIESFDELSGVEGWATKIGNQNRTFQKKNAPLKAQAILQAANHVASHGIDSMEDLRAALSNEARRAALKTSWLNIVSQSSGLTWDYFLMLAGEQGVKADRMVVRFVERALAANQPGSISVAFAKSVVIEGASQLGVAVSNLDHAIWRFESGRSEPGAPVSAAPSGAAEVL